GDSVVRMVVEIKKIYDRYADKEDLVQHDDVYSEDWSDYYEYDNDWDHHDYSYADNDMSDCYAYEEESEPEFDYGDDSPFEGIKQDTSRGQDFPIFEEWKLHQVSMGKKFNKKITWTIKDFSSLPADIIYSDPFVVDGCNWCLTAYPKGYNFIGYLSLYLEVADNGALPFGWRRRARYTLTIVNQNSEKNFQPTEAKEWFDDSTRWGCPSIIPLNEINAKDSGFLINGELKIVAEIDILEVIGDVDVSEGISVVKETIDVNGFQLLPSQATSVSHMFERHPAIASEFRPKNPSLRTGYMSLLLSLIETLSQSPQELSKDDLCDVYIALGYMTDAGFKLDWLEKKLFEVAQKKEDDEAGETRLRELEEELKDMKLKCSKMEALVEEEKAKVSAAKAPLSFDDVV
ncbi:MATH/TRAF domain, partial [Arabidopsis thaliana x Arabidopsis arenosa]